MTVGRHDKTPGVYLSYAVNLSKEWGPPLEFQQESGRCLQIKGRITLGLGQLKREGHGIRQVTPVF